MTHKMTKLAFASAALLLAGQAFAHTGVRDQATESTGSYNGFTITHGCGGHDGVPYPVLGQSAVFPFGDDVVWRDEAGKIIQEGGNGNGAIDGEKLSLSLAAVEGYSSSFTRTKEIVDGLGNVRGVLWKNGAMAPNNYTITPFRITAPKIINNCVKLGIRIGVINYCDLAKNEKNDIKGPYKQPKDAFGNTVPFVMLDPQVNAWDAGVYVTIPAGNDDNNRADWWFTAPAPTAGYGGSKYYVDADLLQPTYWTTLTVNNSAADLAACKGTVSTVTVEPSARAFDEILSPANTRPFTAGNGPL